MTLNLRPQKPKLRRQTYPRLNPRYRPSLWPWTLAAHSHRMKLGYGLLTPIWTWTLKLNWNPHLEPQANTNPDGKVSPWNQALVLNPLILDHWAASGPQQCMWTGTQASKWKPGLKPTPTRTWTWIQTWTLAQIQTKTCPNFNISLGLTLALRPTDPLTQTPNPAPKESLWLLAFDPHPDLWPVPLTWIQSLNLNIDPWPFGLLSNPLLFSPDSSLWTVNLARTPSPYSKRFSHLNHNWNSNLNPSSDPA